MLSFIKKYAETINGADVYPKVALFFFLIVFLGMILIAWKADKSYISEMEHMPLDKLNP
jgi:hypothetical protein